LFVLLLLFCLLSAHAGLLLTILTGPVRQWFREAKRLRALSNEVQEQMILSELIVKAPATLALVLVLAFCSLAPAADPTFHREAIFPSEHKHNHASCVVELPGGDLLTAWYNGTGEREADDVKILGARMNKSSGVWTPPFLLADTPGYPDCNPALFAAPDKTLWLFWPTILDHRWEGALLKFATTDTPPDGREPAQWKHEGVLHITPTGFDKAMTDALGTLNGAQLTLAHSYFEKLEERSKDELYQRLGWMPRVHPTVLPSGRWLLPLYSDTFSASIVAISDDHGTSWNASKPIIGFGNIQPSIVRKDGGTLIAYMRENGPRKRIRVSTSKDEGVTWSAVVDSTLLNPGAGIEALRLADGHWAMIYNDTVKGRHSLAVSLSDDEGTTWSVTRHVATGAVGDEQFHYPSIIQTSDGLVHTTFTNSNKSNGSTIDHAVFSEDWVRQRDDATK
jgi:predicted neuraminidase